MAQGLHAAPSGLDLGDITNRTTRLTKGDSVHPAQWKQQGDIFTINDHGTDYYPAFGLEKDAGYRPYRVMSKIIDIFKEDKDGWGMAFWFQSINSYLGGLRPQDLIATDPDLVIDAALDEVRGVTHG
ncbi:hypothetical protein ACT3TQ_05900 [Halomonas sp. AOP12-C2-37]|uniref:hypothetical protein n=1 Tax=Halomonas TaxID=2745 RepID=UPI001D004A45|nr:MULTISPECIES: hypothetical protein [Halomonas]